VWAKRAKNALAKLAIGDGVMQIVAPQEHERLWMVGPTWLGKAKGIGWLAENPRYTRLLGAAQVGGLCGSPSDSTGAHDTGQARLGSRTAENTPSTRLGE
jgi:hypothetical protein